MSTNPVESVAPFFHSGSETGTRDSASHAIERRSRTRTTVHWPILLFREKQDGAIESLTHDLSSGGFFCLSPAAFSPGEALTCAMRIPSYDPAGGEQYRVLQCRVRVVRSGPVTPDGQFGVACQIEDYRLVGGNPHP